MLTGCGGSKEEAAPEVKKGDEQTAQVELKFLHKWPQPQNMPYFEEVIKEFEATHPNIKINMEAVADEPIKDKLRVLMGTDCKKICSIR
jgi:raffinose/stachyose/melibiose transport system substrate-binding protein